MILRGAGDGIEGERIACLCRKITSKRVVVGSHAHRAMEIIIAGTPARCYVLKPLRALR